MKTQIRKNENGSFTVDGRIVNGGDFILDGKIVKANSEDLLFACKAILGDVKTLKHNRFITTDYKFLPSLAGFKNVKELFEGQ